MDINKRIENFESFRTERLPVLHEFSKALGFANSHEILNNPQDFLSQLNDWLADQEVIGESRIWIATRIGYFIGEYFVVKYDGCWSVCEASASKYYGHYVVSDFSAFNNASVLFDPIEAAYELVCEPIGRSLSGVVNEIEESLNTEQAIL